MEFLKELLLIQHELILHKISESMKIEDKDKLYDLALNYMPKNIFDDPFLVMKMVKIDPNIIDLIGKKLKKNKKFMNQVWKD